MKFLKPSGKIKREFHPLSLFRDAILLFLYIDGAMSFPRKKWQFLRIIYSLFAKLLFFVHIFCIQYMYMCICTNLYVYSPTDTELGN